VRDEEVLRRVNEERIVPHTIKSRNASWIRHALRRNCLLIHLIKAKIKLTGKRGRRSEQLLDDLMETRGYCKLKEEALDRNLRRTRFGRGYGPVVRHKVTNDSP